MINGGTTDLTSKSLIKVTPAEKGVTLTKLDFPNLDFNAKFDHSKTQFDVFDIFGIFHALLKLKSLLLTLEYYPCMQRQGKRYKATVVERKAEKVKQKSQTAREKPFQKHKERSFLVCMLNFFLNELSFLLSNQDELRFCIYIFEERKGWILFYFDSLQQRQLLTLPSSRPQNTESFSSNGSLYL